MKLYDKIKPYIISTCISFTIVSLLQEILFMSKIMEAGIEISLVYHIFIVCMFVNIVIFLTDLIPFESLIIRMIVGAMDVIVVVFFSNIVIFKVQSSFTFVDVVTSVILLIITYVVVTSIVSVKNKADEKQINKELKQRRNN